MDHPEGADFEGQEFDADAMLWAPGVDYVAGWRAATEAVGAFRDALEAAGLDVEGSRIRANAASDGSGVVHLKLSAETARRVARLVHMAAWRWRQAS